MCERMRDESVESCQKLRWLKDMIRARTRRLAHRRDERAETRRETMVDGVGVEVLRVGVLRHAHDGALVDRCALACLGLLQNPHSPTERDIALTDFLLDMIQNQARASKDQDNDLICKMTYTDWGDQGMLEWIARILEVPILSVDDSIVNEELAPETLSADQTVFSYYSGGHRRGYRANNVTEALQRLQVPEPDQPPLLVLFDRDGRHYTAAVPNRGYAGFYRPAELGVKYITVFWASLDI